MKIILVTWGSYEKTAYPFEKDTLTKIISNFENIENIEIIEFLGSIYQPQDQLQSLPFEQRLKTNKDGSVYIAKKGGE